MSNPFEDAAGEYRDSEKLLPGELRPVRDATPIKKRKMASMTKHNFQWHNYKRPTFCAHCGNLLVGLIKQGKQCKRCTVDVHDKCQEDLRQPCKELIIGQHNFLVKTYKQPTYCDYCTKLLVGLVNQGLKCTECQTNVHEKCEEKIEAKCEQTKSRKSKDLEVIRREKVSRKSQRSSRPTSKTEKVAMKNLDPSGETEESPDALFATMPSKRSSAGKQYVESPIHAKNMTPVGSPAPSPQFGRKPGASGGASTSAGGGGQMDQANKMVGEVIEIMADNVKAIGERQDKLETLRDNAEQLEEKANLFEKNAEKIKKKMWLKNYKMWIILIVVALIVIAIIVVSVVLSKKKK